MLAAATQSGDASSGHLASLVRDLGDPRFAVRQRASRELSSLGATGKPALLSALADADAEVRHRAQRVLAGLLEADFQARLEAFVADLDGRQQLDLPGWKTYRDLAGNSAVARRLFADVVRAEPVLLETVEQDPRHAADSIANRCDELVAGLAPRRFARGRFIESGRVPLASAAALMLSACNPDVPIDDRVGTRVFQMFQQSQMFEELGSSPRELPLRCLLGGWIRRNADTSFAFQGLWLALRYDLKEGLAPATALAGRADQPPYVRQLAILSIGRLGTRRHVPLLMPLLNDTTSCDANELVRAVYHCEVRDVALAAIIHLHGQSPKDFGFARVSPNSQTLFALGSMGFADQQHRAAAMAQWKSWLARQPGQADKKTIAGS